jgi:hypothetical protein
MKLTNKQKRELADHLRIEADLMIEKAQENNGYYEGIKDIDPVAAREQIAKWLEKLPWPQEAKAK